MSIASEFLADVFGTSTEAPIYVCSLPNAKGDRPGERRLITRDLGQVDIFLCKEDRPGRAIYGCTATVQRGAKTRSKQTIVELNSLFIDIDFKSVEAAPEEISRILKELELPPSKVVASGHGLHAYWLFRESIPATPENIANHENLLRRLADILGGDPQCAESSRLMRLPGSHNTKNGEVILVRAVADRACRYELEELEEWVEGFSAPIIRRNAAKPNGKGGTGAAADPFEAYADGVATAPVDVNARLAAMRFQGPGDTAIHATQLAVSASLLNQGTPLDDVVARLLEATRTAAGPAGASWDWQREAQELHKMCKTWLDKLEAEGEEAPTPETSKKPPALRVINPADLSDEAEPRKWVVPDYIPAEEVTLFTGDGATGKSLLALQLAVARALTRGWIGLTPEPGKTLVLSAEDDAREVHRRLAACCQYYDVKMKDLGNIQILDLVGEDSILGLLNRGQIRPTAVYTALSTVIEGFEPSLVILDVLANLFAGEENNRPQSQQFVALLKRLCLKHQCAVVLLAHPSLAGMASGTGLSGSTAWHNSVRSRLYLRTPKISDEDNPEDEEQNRNLRIFRGKKANYSKEGGRIDLEWKNGVFVPVEEPGGLDRLEARQRAEFAFLQCLKRFEDDGRVLSGAPTANNYAPTVFEKQPECRGIAKRALVSAMERLFEQKKIRVEPYGPKSRGTKKLVIVP